MLDTSLSRLGIQMQLEELYKKYVIGLDREEFKSMLVTEYFDGSKIARSVIYQYLERIYFDFIFVNVDMLSFLRSENFYTRRAARRFIKLFWHIYEYDEVIVHSIHKYKGFHPLLAKNPKYARFYGKFLTEQEYKEKGKIIKLEQPSEKMRITIRVDSLLAGLPTKRQLKDRLVECLETGNKNDKILLKHFIGMLSVQNTETALGSDMLVNMHGLAGSEAYKLLSEYLKLLSE